MIIKNIIEFFSSLPLFVHSLNYKRRAFFSLLTTSLSIYARVLLVVMKGTRDNEMHERESTRASRLDYWLAIRFDGSRAHNGRFDVLSFCIWLGFVAKKHKSQTEFFIFISREINCPHFIILTLRPNQFVFSARNFFFIFCFFLLHDRVFHSIFNVRRLWSTLINFMSASRSIRFVLSGTKI